MQWGSTVRGSWQGLAHLVARDETADMNVTVRWLTPDLWPALEDLFGERGAASRCWCMYWRIGPDYRERPAYQQNDYLIWIGQARREATRTKRINQMLDELEAGGVYMKMKHPPSARR
jgi:hypothetical protein